MNSKYLKIAVLLLAAVTGLNSCQERIDDDDKYTFTSNTVATYLQDLEECSHFVNILTRGEVMGLMKAYGQYTCFAPTNEAVEQFVKEQYEIYRKSKEESEKPGSKVKVINTGITSPEWSELSDSMCAVISRNHILSALYLRIDFKGNSIPHANMNERDLILGIDTLTKRYVIDKTAPVKGDEEEVENGVVHIVEGIINPSSLGVSTLLDGYSYFSIFNEALIATGLDKELEITDDRYYFGEGKIVDGLYASEVVPYPAKRRFGFTIFLETDETLAKLGITSFESLETKCKEEYYKEGTKVWARDKNNKWVLEEVDHKAPYTDWHNPVKQFVAYHLMDRKVMYENLVCFNIELNAGGVYHSETNFLTNTPRTEYYVTMNNRILKVTMPRGDEREKIYLNYAANGEGQNVLVIAPNDFTKDAKYKDYRQEALNGSLNVIDDVIYYHEKTMKDVVLNEIMRIDMAALFSELTNNRMRWNYINTTERNRDAATYVPHGYSENLRVYTDNSRIFYLPPHDLGYFNYQGDEMMALGLYDFDCLLPPVPENTYEIRLGYTANPSRGVAQVYLDNEVTGIPIDLTIQGKDAKIGWKPDKGTEDGGMNGDEELITANDKDMKNRGYLKGPKSFYADEELARDDHRCLRVVIATKQLSEEREHWLRFKNVGVRDPENAQLMLDYLEIVPIGYLRREDITVDQKRY